MARWLSAETPAQASPTTRTGTPASAAATAVESTQQSVDTPQSTIVASPTRSASAGPHLENVVASTVGPVGPSSGTTSHSGASGGCRANGHCGVVRPATPRRAARARRTA